MPIDIIKDKLLVKNDNDEFVNGLVIPDKTGLDSVNTVMGVESDNYNGIAENLTDILSDCNAKIVEKGGTEADKVANLPSAIESIEGGGGLTELQCNYVDNQTTFRLLLKDVGEGEIKIDMSNSTQNVIPLGCLYDSGFSIYTFNNISSLSINFRASCTKSSSNIKCKIINFHFTDESSNIYQIYRSENAMLFSAIEELNGIIWDLSGFYNQDMQYNHFWNRSANLREIRLKRNSWNGGTGNSSKDLRLQTSNSFSDESIYSIAFCLFDRSTETSVYKVHLHSDIKSKLNNLYCYYDINTNQYEKCDSSKDGAITLTNYITNIVNWTIA